MGNFKKMLFGEKMPDKDDPQYRERYEKEVSAGMKFARATRLDRVAARVQQFASRHTRLFLLLVFGFVLACFTMNVYRLFVVSSQSGTPARAVERQEEALRRRHRQTRDFATSAQTKVQQEINRQSNE